ncbi:LysR substrate-binding domain-containing protein [Glaesserella sp.]|uniref:LysR substrate-binding domain-containing protein n=1 Tax=Glaesserella sp. TaxID=2094731 RepID=UPI00359F5D12
MKNHLDLNDLYLFVQVVNAGSFSEAGRLLCMPKATISRRIAKLEKYLGVALIQRTTHQFEVTHIGQQYYEYCLELVEQVQKAQDFIEQYSESKGKIRLSCPVALLDLYVNDMLVDFITQYPEIDLYVESTNRQVDLISERLDFALRVRSWPLKDSDIVTKPFCLSKHLVVASPKLVEKTLNNPEELKHYPVLMGNIHHYWEFEHRTHGNKTVRFSPKLVTENLDLLHKNAVNGVGIAVMPEVIVRKALKQGSLKLVLNEEWQLPKYMVHAAYRSRKSLQPSARLLLDFLAVKFAETDIVI